MKRIYNVIAEDGNQRVREVWTFTNLNKALVLKEQLSAQGISSQLRETLHNQPSRDRLRYEADLDWQGAITAVRGPLHLPIAAQEPSFILNGLRGNPPPET